MSALAACLVVAQLVNPSFEDDLSAPKGWTREIGATTGNGPLTAEIAIVEHYPTGPHAVEFRGTAATQRWPMLTQTFPVKPGQRVLFRMLAKAKGLRREANQYANANALMIFQTEHGRRITILTSPVLSGDTGWEPLVVTAIAPQASARVVVGIFASMSGTVTFDSAELTIASTDRRDPEARRAAFEALRLHLAQTYPFFGMKGKPKNALALSPDPANEDFTAELNRTLAALDDLHVWYDDNLKRIYPGPRNPHPANYNVPAIRGRLKPVLLQKRNRLIGRIGDVGYVGLGSFLAAEFDGIEAALDKLADSRALILDLRFNNGGDETLAQRIAQRFARTPTVYARQQLRDPFDEGKFIDSGRRQIAPQAGRPPDTRPVVVLQGPHCVSSGEGFLMMMRALGGNVRTVGLPSRGASGNPKPFQLLPDLVIYSSTWRSLLPDGTCIEGAGVPPTHRFEAPAEAYRKGDPTLDHALELLAK